MAALCKRLFSLKSILGDEFKQLMCLGLDQAGKTHLMYRLLLGREQKLYQPLETMRSKRITKSAYGGDEETGGDVFEDVNESYFAGYLYEEFQMFNSCGIWDVPGTPAMRQMWKYIYQTIQIHGIFYVIDGKETGTDTLERRRLSNRLLNMLMNEEELKQCFFAVIVNQKEGAALPGAEDSKAGEKPGGGDSAETPHSWWETELGIDTLPEIMSWRVRLFVIDVDKIDDESDPKFSKVIDFGREVLGDSRSFGFKLGGGLKLG